MMLRTFSYVTCSKLGAAMTQSDVRSAAKSSAIVSKLFTTLGYVQQTTHTHAHTTHTTHKNVQMS